MIACFDSSFDTRYVLRAVSCFDSCYVPRYYEELKDKIPEILFSEWKINKKGKEVYDITLIDFTHPDKRKIKESHPTEYYIFIGFFNKKYEDFRTEIGTKVKFWITVKSFKKEIIRHLDFSQMNPHEKYDIKIIAHRYDKRNLHITQLKLLDNTN